MFQSLFIPKRYVPHRAILRGSVSAGNPLDPDPFIPHRYFRIPPVFRRFGMYVLVIEGDSMTLPDGTGLTHGSYVLIDSRDIFIDRGHVFAFRKYDGSHVIKRLDLHSGHMSLFSDNTAYPPIRVTSSLRNAGKAYAASQDGKNWTPLKYTTTRR